MYALVFTDAGLSPGRISTLFAIWSLTGFIAEVPAGVLADRWSRRGCLVLAGALQAAAYAAWTVVVSFAGFAAGFVLWGVSGALSSGALEALVYDGLAELGVPERFAEVYGRVSAAGLVANVPAAVGATLLLAAGGYPAVGWASVGCCGAAAMLAARLPEAKRAADEVKAAPLVFGWRLLRVDRAIRRAAAVLAAVAGLDAVEEYFGLLTRSWGVPNGAVPLVLLAIPLAGAAGARWSGWLARASLAVPLAGAAVLLVLADAWARPAAVVAVAVAYALYRATVVAAQAGLQHRVHGPARATVTSIAALFEEGPVLAVYGAWALGGLPAFAALVLVVALSTVPRLPSEKRIMGA